MMIGSIVVDSEHGIVHTHRDSYTLSALSVVSVRRPLLPFAFMTGLGLASFTAAFGDLLYTYEVAITLSCAVVSLLAGWHAGQLKLLSRDLRGSELSGAIWGKAARLNIVRADIAKAVAAARKAYP